MNHLKDKFIGVWLVAVGISITTSSCVKDNFDFNKVAEVRYNPNFAIPLVNSSLSLDNMLKNLEKSNGFLKKESDNSLTIIYKSSYASLGAEELVSVPNQSETFNDNNIGNKIAPISLSQSKTVNDEQTYNFTTSTSSKVDSITFKSGNISFAVNSTLNNGGSVVITIPEAKKNGVTFSQTIPLNFTGAVPVTASAKYDLSGYTFDMTLGGTTFNKFIIKYDVTVVGTSNPPGGSEVFSVTATFGNNVKFSRMFGDIGTFSIASQKDTLPLSLFSKSQGTTSFSLADPKVKLITKNSFGIPIDIKLQTLQGETPGLVPYSIPNTLPLVLAINTPGISQAGQALEANTLLNNGNSKIAQVINNTPQQINYNLSMAAKSAPSQNNFILDNSRLDVDFEFELPLNGTAVGFVLSDTIPFSLGNDFSENLQSGLMRLFNSNGFPLDVNLQVYFTDSLYATLDSLITPSQLILKSGPVNASTGKVTAPQETTLDVTFTKERLKKISTCNYILVRGSINTAQAGTVNVKIYSDYKLDVKLGLQLEANIKVNPNSNK